MINMFYLRSIQNIVSSYLTKLYLEKKLFNYWNMIFKALRDFIQIMKFHNIIFTHLT